MVKPVDSPEAMIKVIRRFGIIPFFKGAVPGWSIEEMTGPEHWFYTSDELGPWDWKIAAVREGDIAYGKFLGNKAAFATVEYYRHLMNWRRSQARYRMALGEKYTAKTHGDKLMKYISPYALEDVKEAGAMESKELRLACSQQLTPYQIKSLGAKYKSILSPTIKKNVMDSVLQFMEMGTWVVIGDIRRVYRGPNLEYNGWQRASITTPDDLFGSDKPASDAPFWAKFVDDGESSGTTVDCSPEESRGLLVDHVLEFFPEFRSEIEKLI